VTRKVNATTYTVRAAGRWYTVDRRLLLHPGHVAVQDTIRNNTSEDLGLIIHNHLNADGKRFQDSYLAGYKSIGTRRETYSPSVFVGRDGLGVGLVPLDDVYCMQAALYYQNHLAGVSTDQFGLAAKASYTLEWSVYPNGSGDYYDFVNAFRKEERRCGKIEGSLDYVNYSMEDRTLILTPDFVRRRNLRYGTLMCLSRATDDPAVSIEGIEFLDFPKERAVLREKMAELRAAYPEVRGMFHVAHSLYCTNQPDRFADSKVLGPDGQQALWPDDGRYISKERQEAGGKWWIFYPTPGNKFHDAFLKSADVIMDEIGCRGVFTDGLMAGYMVRYTYDRWDGHTVEIDPQTQTIKRKMASVLLLSQPSVVEFVRKINAKGGVVIANNSMITRTFAREKIITNREVIGPDTHLAPTVVCLGTPSAFLKNETDLYRDVLQALGWGSLYFLCGLGPQVPAESLVAQLYPITCEEIHSGTVKGPERLITTHSGVYGWPGTRDLHFAYHYDGRGVPVPPSFLTTVDRSGVRTQIILAENESAVLKRIPLSVQTARPLNVRCRKYDREGMEIVLNGQGPVQVTLRNGEFPLQPNAAYTVAAPAASKVTADAQGRLSFPLVLHGELTVTVQDNRLYRE
jgi:hypothetical protein